MATAATRSHIKRADARPRGEAVAYAKRSKSSSDASNAALEQAVKLFVAGGRSARKAKARSGASVLHGIRQIVDLAEKNVRVIDLPVALAPGPEMLEDWDFIVRTVNKIGERFRLRASTSVPRKTATKASSTLKPLTTRDSRVEPVLGSNDEMINSGLLQDSQAFQTLMGWSTRQALSKAVQSNRVFYLTHRSERYFPAFYGDSAYERSHLETVSKILGDLPGGSKLQFFLTPKRSLDGQTPLQALAAGRFAKVKDLASAFAEVPVPRS